MRSRIYCALDTHYLDQALEWARDVRNAVDGLKLGLEFFNAHGTQGIRRVLSIAGPNTRLFLDLKFHDIPKTVYGAIHSVAALQPEFMTVHASGGVDMMRAAHQAAQDKACALGVQTAKILAVTVLTHLDADDLNQVGQGENINDQVKRLADLAMKAGLSGVVCSPQEVEMLRSHCGDEFTLMVPGIRPKGVDKADQKRVMSPEEAIAKGASCLVVGRAITGADNPGLAALEIVNKMEQYAA